MNHFEQIDQIYLVRLGENGIWHDRSLSENLLRFGWEALPLQDIRTASKQALKVMVQNHFPDMSLAAASHDASDIIKLRDSQPGDIWVTIHPKTKQLSWTRLVDGQVEADSVSNFRRAIGWRNSDADGNLISGLSDEVNKINRSSSRAINRMVDERRFKAIRSTIFPSDRVRDELPLAKKPDPPVTLQQRKILEELWNKLRRPIGITAPIGSAGHGLQVCVDGTKRGWRASMYWSNSKSGNAVSFCIHANRLALGGQATKCALWLKAWSNEFGARSAEVRSAEVGVSDAIRFGFDFESGLKFLEHFVATMTDFTRTAFNRWDTLPMAAHVSIDTTLNEMQSAGSLGSGNDLEKSRGYLALAPSIPVVSSSWALSISEMVHNAKAASAQSGELREQVMKNKLLGFDDGQLYKYIENLIAFQGQRCKLTGLPLHFRGQAISEPVDAELLASLDRIDSAKGYEEGNLQVVCRFVNKWKGTSSQDEFCKYLDLVRSVRQ